MKSKLLHESGGKLCALVFESGDEVVSELLKFAKRTQLQGACFFGVDACYNVTIGFFDLERKDYVPTVIKEQVEIISLIGNVAAYNGEPKIHAHIVIGKRDSTAHGGHLIEAVVRPTLEIFLTESTEIIRRLDAVTNLPLIDLTTTYGSKGSPKWLRKASTWR